MLKGVDRFDILTFCLFDILPFCLFAFLPFCHFAFLPVCHFAFLTFRHLDILTFCLFATAPPKVTGGQGGDDEVLGSAEFFDLATQQWTMVIMMM